MKRELLINKTINTISSLPKEEIKNILQFSEYLKLKLEHKILSKGVEEIVQDSEAFSFLNEEEDLYDISDLKEKYK